MCGFTFTQTDIYDLAGLEFKFAIDRTQANPITVTINNKPFPLPAKGQTPIAFLVQNAQLLVGSISQVSRPRISVPLISNAGTGTLRVMQHGGGIGISDLRDGRTSVVSADLSNGPMEAEFEIVHGVLFMHVTCLGVNAACGTPYFALITV